MVYFIYRKPIFHKFLFLYSFFTTSMVLPPMPKFLSGNSLIVTVKNSCGIFIISDDISVNRRMSVVFCSSVSLPLSILI